MSITNFWMANLLTHGQIHRDSLKTFPIDRPRLRWYEYNNTPLTVGIHVMDKWL